MRARRAGPPTANTTTTPHHACCCAHRTPARASSRARTSKCPCLESPHGNHAGGQPWLCPTPSHSSVRPRKTSSAVIVCSRPLPTSPKLGLCGKVCRRTPPHAPGYTQAARRPPLRRLTCALRMWRHIASSINKKCTLGTQLAFKTEAAEVPRALEVLEYIFFCA